MELDIKDTNSGLVIRHNGRLLTEYGVGSFTKDEEYENDVVVGRVARSFIQAVGTLFERASRLNDAHDHAHPTEEKRQAAFFRGMRDGFQLQSIPHPYEGVPPINPEHSITYGNAYECAAHIQRCFLIMQEDRKKVARTRPDRGA